jgi:hypothetical protein
MSFIKASEEDLEKFFHPINSAVAKALADAQVEAKAELGIVSGDVKAALAKGLADAKAANPALEAGAESLANELIKLAVAALAAHGV